MTIGNRAVPRLRLAAVAREGAQARRIRRQGRREQALVGLVDAAVAAALWLVVQLSAGALGMPVPTAARGIAFALSLGLVGTLVLAGTGQYERERLVGEGLLRRAEQLLAPALATVWVAQLVDHSVAGISIPWVLAGPFGLLLAGGWLMGRHLVLHAAAHEERVIVMGTGVVAEQIVRLLQRYEGEHVNVLGFVADRPQEMGEGLPPVIGKTAELPALMSSERVDRIIVAYSDEPDLYALDALRRSSGTGVRMQIVPRFFDLMGHHVRTTTIGPLALIAVAGSEPPVVAAAGKRLFDLTVALVGLVLLSPLMLVVAALIRLQDGGPALFRQRRIGRDGKPFSILKFRTMVADAQSQGLERISGLHNGELSLSEAVERLKPENDPRVTRVGAFLRASSLDELPQLINVLRGQMSLVGPRPLCDWEVAGLEEWQGVRQLVRPGITGHWQTMGRSEVGWDERMQMDYTYVRHWSLREDFRILTRTVAVALGRDRGAR